MRRARFRVLGIYAALQALMQFEWLRFAPITSQAAASYGVSPGQIGTLSLVFPLLFLVLALPSGALIDRLSVRACLRISAVAMAGGGLLRVLAPSWELLLAGQLVFAAAQPLVMSLIGRVATIWFEGDARQHATDIASMAMFVGMGLAFVLVPLTGEASVPDSLGLDAAVLGALALLTFVLVPADPAAGTAAPGPRRTPWLATTLALLRTAPFPAVLWIVFFAGSSFNGVSTWLEPILQRRDVSVQVAGFIGLAMLVAGILAMALTPIVHRAYSLRAILLGTVLAAIAATALLFSTGDLIGLCVAGVVFGAAILGPLPLLIRLVAELAGAEHAGSAVSVFWLASNAGAVVGIWGLSFVADSGQWTLGAMLLIAMLVAQTLVVVLGMRRAVVQPA